jgi:hypothetical protein
MGAFRLDLGASLKGTAIAAILAHIRMYAGGLEIGQHY